MLGGMFAAPNEATFKTKPPQAYFATDFLDQMYEATPGIKSQVPAASPCTLHRPTTRQLTPDIEEFRGVLKLNRDAGKGLWITEIGWSSEPPTGATTASPKGPSGQATQLKGAFQLFKRQPGANGTCSGSTGSRSTTSRASATSAAAPVSSATASCRRSPGAPTSSSPAARAGSQTAASAA